MGRLALPGSCGSVVSALDFQTLILSLNLVEVSLSALSLARVTDFISAELVGAHSAIWGDHNTVRSQNMHIAT